ncbi:MAG: HEAT repeat domain-containing protein [Spirochaetales bacterium]|nr:HEAT repeat domain-containing protein [Spirochaetales bacterium]
MKTKYYFVLTLIIMLSIAVPLTAQNNSKEKNKKELTVEELYLKDIEFQILKEKAFSNDRDMKLKALNDLEKQINEGSVNKDNREVEFVLEYLSMEGIGRKVLENRRLTNYFPEVRRRSCNLLGKIGGEQAKNALIAVLLNDNEPMVKSEAAYALGNIGLNDNNEVVKALLFALNQQDPTRVDNNFAYAIILSLEKIAKKNNGIKDPSAYRALVKIAQGNYIRTVKNKALHVLDEMRQYK